MSNAVNYSIDIKSPDDLIYVEPNESAEINIIFTPSTIGNANHDCEIVFQNDKVNFFCLFDFPVVILSPQPLIDEKN